MNNETKPSVEDAIKNVLRYSSTDDELGEFCASAHLLVDEVSRLRAELEDQKAENKVLKIAVNNNIVADMLKRPLFEERHVSFFESKQEAEDAVSSGSLVIEPDVTDSIVVSGVGFMVWDYDLKEFISICELVE